MKKSFKTILSLILVLCIFVSIPLSASAATFVKSSYYTLGGNSQSGTKAVMALWTASTRYVYFDKTNCATHTQGTLTTYHFEKTETVKCYASKSLTQEYSAAFSSLADELGVAYYATATVKIGEPHNIPASSSSGQYCFRAKFTCYKVIEEVVTCTATEENVIWTNTISSAPADSVGKVIYHKI